MSLNFEFEPEIQQFNGKILEILKVWKFVNEFKPYEKSQLQINYSLNTINLSENLNAKSINLQDYFAWKTKYHKDHALFIKIKLW